MINKNIIAICIMTLLTGCSTMFTGAEVRDRLNSSIETMVDWDCLGQWDDQVLDYSETISNEYFENRNFNSYKLTKDNSEKHGILLMHGEPYNNVRVETVLSPNEAIITLDGYGKLYYFNSKAVKNGKPAPAFYDGQIITVEDTACVALDENKTHSYQSISGKKTVQNVTIIPRYMKNQFYKQHKEKTETK